jgi:hypothetical protein
MGNAKKLKCIVAHELPTPAGGFVRFEIGREVTAEFLAGFPNHNPGYFEEVEDKQDVKQQPKQEPLAGNRGGAREREKNDQ